jgi:hypothetical protein
MKFPNIPGMKSMMQRTSQKACLKTMCNMMSKLGTGPAKYEEGLTGVNKASKGEIPIFGGGALMISRDKETINLLRISFIQIQL